MGWRKFQVQAKSQGYNLSDDDAAEAVNRWRDIYADIAAGWRRCDLALENIADKRMESIDSWELCHTAPDGIVLPGNNYLRYPDLRDESDNHRKHDWVFGQGRFKTRTYGAKICENIVQSLARHILIGQMLQIQKRYLIAHTVHDEVILVVPEEQAQEALDFMLDTMKTPPKWWPDIVLWAEGDYGDCYADVK